MVHADLQWQDRRGKIPQIFWHTAEEALRQRKRPCSPQTKKDNVSLKCFYMQNLSNDLSSSKRGYEKNNPAVVGVDEDGDGDDVDLNVDDDDDDLMEFGDGSERNYGAEYIRNRSAWQPLFLLSI